jgi:transcriptional regulator with XRE-family HTH domain
MEIAEIKEQMKAQQVTIKELADRLCVSYNALRQIMSGQRPLTAQLSRHIELELGIKREEVVIYRVALPDEKAKRVAQYEAAVPAAVLQAIVHGALEELAGLGAQMEWTAEERRLFWLPPAVGAGDEVGGRIDHHS